MIKKVIILTLVVSVFAIVIVLVVNTTQVDVFPLGSKLPGLIYTINNQNNMIEMDTAKPLIIMFFSTECGHCKFQLDLLNKNVDKLSKTNMLFLSSDENFNEYPIRSNWKILFDKERNNIRLGFINNEIFKEYFGTKVTPAFFVFNIDKILIDKIYGETKFVKLLETINKSDDAQHRISGIK